MSGTEEAGGYDPGKETELALSESAIDKSRSLLLGRSLKIMPAEIARELK